MMSAKLNHTIVWVRDAAKSAAFLAEVLGLPQPVRFGPFYGVQLANEVTLDFMATSKPIFPQHYAFLVSEAEFDAIFDRIRARNLPHWADPGHQQPSQINHHDGGRGVYWSDADGNNLEIITRPYGSAGE
jgi:catechol 2,3-dioxygenase-like lactoylglutathione lyase family enzyme